MKIVVPKFPKKWVDVKPLPLREGYADTDKDLFPNVVDCSYRNPKKQGAISWIQSKIQKRPYEEVEKERYERSGRKKAMKHEYRMARLKEKTAEEQERINIQQARQKQVESRIALEKERIGLSERRQTLMAKRQKAMPSIPTLGSVFGGTASQQPVKMPSLNEVWGMKPATPTPSTKPSKKRKGKRKGKRKSKKEIVIPKGYTLKRV